MFGDWWHHLESNFVTQYEVAKVVVLGWCWGVQRQRMRGSGTTNHQSSATHPANTPVCIIMVFMRRLYISFVYLLYLLLVIKLLLLCSLFVFIC